MPDLTKPPLRLTTGATVTWPPQPSSSQAHHVSVHSHVATNTAATSTGGAVAVYTPGEECEGLDTSGLECATYTVTEEDYQEDSYEWESEPYDPSVLLSSSLCLCLSQFLSLSIFCLSPSLSHSISVALHLLSLSISISLHPLSISVSLTSICHGGGLSGGQLQVGVGTL